MWSASRPWPHASWNRTPPPPGAQRPPASPRPGPAARRAWPRPSAPPSAGDLAPAGVGPPARRPVSPPGPSNPSGSTPSRAATTCATSRIRGRSSSTHRPVGVRHQHVLPAVHVDRKDLAHRRVEGAGRLVGLAKPRDLLADGHLARHAAFRVGQEGSPSQVDHRRCRASGPHRAGGRLGDLPERRGIQSVGERVRLGLAVEHADPGPPVASRTRRSSMRPSSRRTEVRGPVLGEHLGEAPPGGEGEAESSEISSGSTMGSAKESTRRGRGVGPGRSMHVSKRQPQQDQGHRRRDVVDRQVMSRHSQAAPSGSAGTPVSARRHPRATPTRTSHTSSTSARRGTNHATYQGRT